MTLSDFRQLIHLDFVKRFVTIRLCSFKYALHIHDVIYEGAF